LSYTTVLAEVKTVLDAVTGIGTTFDYQKRIPDGTITPRDTAFVTGGIYHVWFITRPSATVTSIGNSALNRSHIFNLIGYYEIDDSLTSEKTVQALCDVIVNDFWTTTGVQLNGVAEVIQPAQLIEFTIDRLYQVLCHRIVIELEVSENVDV